jgi:hypothetical protein
MARKRALSREQALEGYILQTWHSRELFFHNMLAQPVGPAAYETISKAKLVSGYMQ